MGHCRDCRFSEGQAQPEAGALTALRLYCTAKGGRAIEVCAAFAPADDDPRDAYEQADQLADALKGRR